MQCNQFSIILTKTTKIKAVIVEVPFIFIFDLTNTNGVEHDVDYDRNGTCGSDCYPDDVHDISQDHELK